MSSPPRSRRCDPRFVHSPLQTSTASNGIFRRRNCVALDETRMGSPVVRNRDSPPVPAMSGAAFEIVGQRLGHVGRAVNRPPPPGPSASRNTSLSPAGSGCSRGSRPRVWASPAHERFDVGAHQARRPGSCRPSRSRRPHRRRAAPPRRRPMAGKASSRLEGAGTTRWQASRTAPRVSRPFLLRAAGSCRPHLRSVSASISGTKTPRTRLPSGTQPSCIRRSAAAEAVLHARITRSHPFVEEALNPACRQVVDVIGIAHAVRRMRVVPRNRRRECPAGAA